MQGQAPFSPAGADPRFPLAGAGLGLLWFLVCLSPTLGLVDHPSLHMSLAWSRYRYLASLGPWALVVGAGLAALRHVSRQPRRLPRALGRGALRGLGLAALLTAGLTTARFSILFSNDATWFQHLTRHAPASDWLASHFVNALIRAGHTGRALRVAEARFLSDPSRLRYRRDRAVARMAAGRHAPAEADFRALVSLFDRDPGLIPPASLRLPPPPWPDTGRWSGTICTSSITTTACCCPSSTARSKRGTCSSGPGRCAPGPATCGSSVPAPPIRRSWRSARLPAPGNGGVRRGPPAVESRTGRLASRPRNARNRAMQST